MTKEIPLRRKMKCLFRKWKRFLSIAIRLQLGNFFVQASFAASSFNLSKGVCDNQNTSRESKHAFFRCHFQLSAHCFDVFSHWRPPSVDFLCVRSLLRKMKKKKKSRRLLWHFSSYTFHNNPDPIGATTTQWPHFSVLLRLTRPSLGTNSSGRSSKPWRH